MEVFTWKQHFADPKLPLPPQCEQGFTDVGAAPFALIAKFALQFLVSVSLLVCFHCPTPIPIPIQMANIIMCRTVSTELIPIPIPIPIPMQMGTVPNLTLILVLIRWNLTSFHCDFTSE